MRKRFVFGLTCFAITLCSSGGNVQAAPVTATALDISGVVATDGIFDPSPRSDASGKLWMSYSTVNHSRNDAALTVVRTRIATSSDGGSSWSDAGVDPNNNPNPDLQVPNPWGSGAVWADWHYEVSGLLYDPYDTDASRRWKMLWHRMLYVSNGSASIPSPEFSWIGLGTAPAPDGKWSAERKLFVGAAYTAEADPFAGKPEFLLDKSSGALSGCAAFTEASMLARRDGIYVSLQCAGSPEKIVELRCDRAFSACTYLGDFLTAGEASRFSLSGQKLNGFAATEMASAGGNDYLIITPYEQVPATDTYRGCLVFRIGDLASATLLRNNGVPALVERISGSSGSFNGACGYDANATSSGIIYSEYHSIAPHFRMHATHIELP